MIRKLIVIFILLVTVIAPTVAMAASYVIDIVVSESAGVDYTDTPIIITINNTALAAGGFIAADARDTQVTNPSGDILPHMITDNATWVVIDLDANSVNTLSYTSGNTEADFEIIPGLGGFVTISDNETIEFAGNFILDITSGSSAANAGMESIGRVSISATTNANNSF